MAGGSKSSLGDVYAQFLPGSLLSRCLSGSSLFRVGEHPLHPQPGPSSLGQVPVLQVPEQFVMGHLLHTGLSSKEKRPGNVQYFQILKMSSVDVSLGNLHLPPSFSIAPLFPRVWVFFTESQNH